MIDLALKNDFFRRQLTVDLRRCKNGHFYDYAKYEEFCPHCVSEANPRSVVFEHGTGMPWITHTNTNANTDDEVSLADFASQTETTIKLPEKMRKFDFMSTIGKGGVGTVYKVKETNEYAVKVVKWNKKSSRRIAKHEFETARIFQKSDNVIKYLNYYENEGSSFLVQELGIP